jgi:DNA repair exonuclease SbcCD nuclease subunit
VCRVSKIDVALSGFPFEYRVDGVHFDRLLTMTSYRDIRADIHLLCMHQVVEGAQVGPSDYTFRKGPQVVSGASIPADFTAVLSGHIHRYQILTHDLAMRRLASPVLYPGAIERTSFAEKHERKGYLTIEVAPDRRGPARLARTVFTPLPTRPMVTLDGDGQSETVETMYADIRERLSKLPPDAIVRIRIRRSMSHEVKAGLRLDRLRQLAPSSMDVRVVPVRNR